MSESYALYNALLEGIRAQGNLRTADGGTAPARLDFSSNDYLGLAETVAAEEASGAWTSSASRLLAADTSAYRDLEGLLSRLYDRPALLLNSGWHANTGLLPALCRAGRTMILADKLVHASMIDGIRLSGADWARFRHNDIGHLQRLLAKAADYDVVIVAVESVYSMDGDCAGLDALVRIKDSDPRVVLYVDEAHAFGVTGPQGLGMARGCTRYADIDVVMGTFGKAAASYGAFAALGGPLAEVAVNCARSFIFSTSLPPAVCRHTQLMVERILTMDSEREHLKRLAQLFGPVATHIVPVIVGDSRRVCELSRRLLNDSGIKVLPIRTPTVPPGTERLRISLSAARTVAEVEELRHTINTLINE